jgi:small subunit ribosomal protein S16
LVRLRFTQTGRKNRESYRLVAEHMTLRRDGRGITFLGYYDPYQKAAPLSLDEEALYTWLKRGAVPTETVRNLLKKQGIWAKWQMIREGKDVSAVTATPKPAKPKRKKKNRDKSAKDEAKPAATEAAPAPVQA